MAGRVWWISARWRAMANICAGFFPELPFKYYQCSREKWQIRQKTGWE
jgi:hypothetical protein